MIQITEYQWKQLIEGGYRQPDPSVYFWILRVDGENLIREYEFNGQIIARMTVLKGNTDMPGQDCERIFESLQQYLDATSWIYVPSDEDIESWNDAGLDIAEQIALRETPP